MKVGFAGIGRMGLPMARNLLRAGVPLRVWSRTPAHCEPLVELGALPMPSMDALCAQSTIVLLMLLDEAAIDAALGRSSPAFHARVADRTIVHLGTTSPTFSRALERDVLASGGGYVEAPVSGSRTPAEHGTLVGMIAGRAASVDAVLPLLAPLCSRVFRCGIVPTALQTKLAANHFLITMVTALAETVHAAHAAGVDLAVLRDVLDAGPMASDVSRIKLDKIMHDDFTPQAAIRDVRNIARLVADQSASAGVDAPLIRRCVDLFDRAAKNGFAELDMIAVVKAFGAAYGLAECPHVGDWRSNDAAAVGIAH
ncbi:MAG: NAD(P)-dependent oxidoreductase [Dokdonella sp.]